MTNVNANNTAARDIGIRAASNWNDAAKYGDGGDALATHALFIAARTMTFTALVNRGTKSEPEIEEVSFDLSDMPNDPFNKDGSVDGKLKSARTVAVAQSVFGYEELDNALKQRLARAVKMALYLSNLYASDDDETYFARVSTRQVKVTRPGGANMSTCLVVPEGAIFAAPADDADEEVRNRYVKMIDEPRTLNGKDKASLAELGRRANPPKAPAAGNKGKSTTDRGASFIGSLDYVRAIVQQNANPNAEESDVALSDEVRRKLFALAQDIASYFAIDPLEDSEEESIAV
jgi:hypothetical protein